MRIAALDEEAGQIDLIRRMIEAIGHEFDGFEEPEALRSGLKAQGYALLILQWNPGSRAGPDLLGWIREKFGSRLPVLCLTQRGSDHDAVEALTAGADDFMVKPIRPAELQARVGALLRRSYPRNEEVLNFGPFRFFLSTRQLQVHGKAAELNDREYELALCLFRNLGRLLSREHLLNAVWGAGAEVAPRSVDTHISRLRTRLDLRPSNGVLLSAVYRLGYRLDFIDGDGLILQAPALSTAE